jgi:hypothetical protein
MLGFQASLGKFPLHIGAILSLLKLISVQAGDIPTLNIIYPAYTANFSHSTENKHYIHYIHLNNHRLKSDICLTACDKPICRK